MVNIHVWYPTNLQTVAQEGIMPDLGHSSLEVIGPDGEPTCYASYWPEMESLVGQITSLFKPRLERHPVSFAQECDPTDGYMQRPPDITLPMVGLQEEIIERAWRHLQNTNYDFLRWNCSNVAKYLMIRSMCEDDIGRLRQKLECSEENLSDVRAHEDSDLAAALRRLALTDFINCIPDDLVQLASVYNEARTEAILGLEPGDTDGLSALLPVKQ